jgi:hypothetical protein
MEEGVDRVEELLQAYADELTLLAQGLAGLDTKADLDELASGLQRKKNEMVAAVQSLAYLDSTSETLLEDLKAWEGLAKQAVNRSQAADKAVHQAETAIKQAIEELRKGDNEVNS